MNNLSYNKESIYLTSSNIKSRNYNTNNNDHSIKENFSKEFHKQIQYFYHH